MPVGHYTRKPRGSYKLRSILLPIGPSIAYVPLSQGQFSLVDSEDFPLLSQNNWHAQWSARMGSFYAKRNRAYEVVSMHRILMGEPKGLDVDHINGNTLDNRRSCNLRAVTTAENIQNQKTRRNNTSGVKGVYWNKRSSRWVAGIQANGVSHSLGSFVLFDDAVLARRNAESKVFGEFARRA